MHPYIRFGVARSRQLISALLLGAVFIYTTNTSFAFAPEFQPEMVSGGACAISDFPSARIVIPPTGVIDEGVYTSIAVSSPSSYRYADVSVVVALYRGESVTPSFWAVIDDPVDVDPGAERIVDVNIDTRSVPAGTYTMKAFAGQGDFDNLLSIALRDGASTVGETVTKTTGATRTFDAETSVAGEPGTSFVIDPVEPIALELRVTNGSDRPIVGASHELVVTNGSLPLGTAVVARETQQMKLLPGSTGAIQVDSLMLESSSYTVYSVIEERNTFHAIDRATISVEGESFERDFAYLPGVAIVEENEEGVEVIACLQTTSDAGFQLNEPVALEVENGERVVFSGDDVGRNLVFTISHRQLAEGVDVSLQRQRPLEVVLSEDGSVSQTADSDVVFESVDSITVSYECQEVGCLESTAQETGTFDSGESNSSNSFYFYLGIVLAAALLMYIMLRRLHPEEKSMVPMSKDELQ